MHLHNERPYSYCPHCGGRLELRSLKSTEPERLVCANCGFVFYVDPKVAVGTIISDADGHIVLVPGIEGKLGNVGKAGNHPHESQHFLLCR